MSKDIIGLKQADGSFYPILKRGTPSKKRLQVTTSKDNQTTVQINLYCASDNSFSDAEFLDTLKIDGLVPHEKKNHQIDLILSLDENDNLSADLNDKESGKTAQKPVNFAPVTRQVPKDISSEIAAFNEKNLEKGDFDPLSAVAQTAAAAGVAFSGMPNTDYATGFANDPLFAGETKIENKENPEDVENFESSELPESTETEESENNAPADESFADFAEQSDLGDAATETDSAENDLIENTELPDFGDTFAADETESESEELPDFGGDFTAESGLIENEELPDFADDFAAENTEPVESEITENAETETEASGDIFESDPAESTEKIEGNFDNSFTGDDLSSFGDLPDFADLEANAAPEGSTETEESENNAPADESFAGFTEQSDLGDTVTETESAENDLIENTELSGFGDTFAADETERESEELPDFGGDFAAESTEPAESEITENAEIETEPSGDIFESEPAESAENTEENFDKSFTGDDLSSFGDLPDFADLETNAAPEESAETENNAPADESFTGFAEQSDLGDAATETESAESDFIENTELPDFGDTFAADETESESEELPDFGGDFTAENGLIENSELPDFGDDFAAESTEPAESEITENAETETEPSGDIFESEPAESAENTEENFDNSFTDDDLSSLGDLPDFADLETNAAPEGSAEAENNALADESFADFAEQSDLGDTVTETESAENDLMGNTELPDFEDTFAAEETEIESEELPDFGGDFTAENDLIENSDLPDFANDFGAEITEPAESEITENDETETEPSGEIFESEPAESAENTEENFDNSFTGDDLSSFGDLPDFADDEANNFAEDDSANEASTDSYFDEAAAVAAMASAGAMGFAAGAASGTGETSDENFVNDGDDDDFSLDDFSDLDADFEMPNEEALAELDKEIDEINMNFSNQTALNEANSFADYFSEDSTYDDLADSYNSSYAAENGITNFDFLNDKSSRPKLPLVPLVCVLCAVISIASCFVIWLLFLNNKNAPAPVVAETAVTKEYQGVSVLKEDPAKPESTASQLEKAMAQENSIIIIDAPIVIPIPVVPVVNQEETKRYQIKRGDTLWDIADSFYKNPWMYEKIAKANRIKNPDYILSGTWIEIPPM